MTELSVASGGRAVSTAPPSRRPPRYPCQRIIAGKRGSSDFWSKGTSDEPTQHARRSTPLEEAVTVLFCLVDDVYQNINPNAQRYENLKKLSDSEVMTLALFQQLRGIDSQRSFLRDAARFFSHLFPEVIGLAPSSLHRRIRKLRSFLEPMRRAVLSDLVGEPETLLIDSTLLSVLHPRQVGQSAGFAGAAWTR